MPVKKVHKWRAVVNSMHWGQTFFEPTVLTDVSRDMEIVQEEIFGPVAPLIRFTDEADVVAQANDTIFGWLRMSIAKIFHGSGVSLNSWNMAWSG